MPKTHLFWNFFFFTFSIWICKCALTHLSFNKRSVKLVGNLYFSSSFICSFEQENLKSKKIQKKCCLTPKHCAAFNTGHAKRADDRKNLHWESCDICFNVFSQTMKKKRLHVSLRMRKNFQTNIRKNLLQKCCFKFYQDTSFLSCTWFQCGNCSTSFNVGLEWCISQYAAYAETEQIFAQGEGDRSCNGKDLDRSLEGNLGRRWMFGVTLIRICPPNA